MAIRRFIGAVGFVAQFGMTVWLEAQPHRQHVQWNAEWLGNTLTAVWFCACSAAWVLLMTPPKKGSR